MNSSGATAESSRCIAVVSNSTWNVCNFRLPVIQALIGAGYRVVVIAPVDESVGTLNQQPGLGIIPLRHLHRNSTGFWNNLLLFFECRRIYRNLQPDLVIHFTIKPNIFGNLAAALLRIPSICVVTGLGYTFLHKGWLQRFTQQLYRFSFRFARKVVFENREDAGLLADLGVVPASKTVVVPGCGVDTRYFQQNGVQPQPGKKVFTFIGRLLADKGIHEFVEAARLVRPEYPEAEFWILGGIDDFNPAHVDRSTLLKWVRDEIVQYKGVAADVRPFIGRSNWIVLPSYREGLSKVLLEAMAMSKPLITSDVAGCKETVEPGRNGFLVPVGNAEALAEVIRSCCALPVDQVEEMGRYGRDKVDREFDSLTVGKVYLDLVNGLLKSHYQQAPQ